MTRTAVLLSALLLLISSTVAQELPVGSAEKLSDAATEVEQFLADNVTTSSPRSSSNTPILNIDEEEPDSHNMHLNSTYITSVLERNRERVYAMGSKGGKKGLEPKQGKKSKQKGGKKDKEKDGDGDGPYEANGLFPTMSAIPSVEPSYIPSAVPSDQPSAQNLFFSPVSRVARLIPGLEIGYIVPDSTTRPSSDDYAALASLTANFLHDELRAYFLNHDTIHFGDLVLELYFIRQVYAVEYQFKTTFAEVGSDVPTVAQLYSLVKEIFSSNVAAYVDTLQTQLEPGNVFSSTTGLSGNAGSVANDNEPPAQTQSSSTDVVKKIVAPVVAVAGVLAIVIALAYYKHRKVAPNTKKERQPFVDGMVKPDEDITLDETLETRTLDTRPSMISPTSSMISSPAFERPSPERPLSAYPIEEDDDPSEEESLQSRRDRDLLEYGGLMADERYDEITLGDV